LGCSRTHRTPIVVHSSKWSTTRETMTFARRTYSTVLSPRGQEGERRDVPKFSQTHELHTGAVIWNPTSSNFNNNSTQCVKPAGCNTLFVTWL
jgi:hypothetical protein